MCSCAPGYFRLDVYSTCRVIALDIVKACNFQLVSHVAQNLFDLQSLHFTEMFISMCSCEPWYFRVDLSSSCRFMALDLV
jgi:hypothetical protein